MNYDHLNTVYEFWRKNILPHLSSNFPQNLSLITLSDLLSFQAGDGFGSLGKLILIASGLPLTPPASSRSIRMRVCVTMLP